LTPIIELVGGNDQAAVYGTAFAQPLTVVVTQSGGTPVAGATVTFAGANLSFSPSATVTTNSSGQASVMATGFHVGDLLATATTPGVNTAVNFARTVTPALLTVTANNASRIFATANPAFTGTIAGAVHGDTFTFSASTIATTSSPVGTYPIIPSVKGAALANYTLQTVNGTLTVNKATLTVTANSAVRLLVSPMHRSPRQLPASSMGIPLPSSQEHLRYRRRQRQLPRQDFIRSRSRKAPCLRRITPSPS
jgi:hypothetical protein